MVSPTATRTYTLSATNGTGTVTASVVVAVIGAPVINRFSASPAAIVTGQSTMLSWDVVGAATSTLSGGGSSWTVTGDSYRILPVSATTTYTLTASNSAGGVTRQTTVTVSAPSALAWVRSMVYGFGHLLSEERADVGTMYVQADQVGSPSLLTDSGGNLVGKTKGLPFGERAWQSGSQSARRFTNHEDQPGSAIYMQARMYLPAYGRFAQPDPAYDQAKLDPESWNLYGYVTNNPVTHTDPDGRKVYGVKEEGEAHITSRLIGDWGDVGFRDAFMPDGFTSLRQAGAAYTVISNRIAVIGIYSSIVQQMLLSAAAMDIGTMVSTISSFKIASLFTDSQFSFELYKVTFSLKEGMVSVQSKEKTNDISTAWGAINGLNNDLDEAAKRGAENVHAEDSAAREFTLVYNPYGTIGGAAKTLLMKLGVPTAETIAFAGILAVLHDRGQNVNWAVHSMGSAIFSGGVEIFEQRTLGVSLNGMNVAAFGPAINRVISGGIFNQAGVGLAGWHANPADPVATFIGMNGLFNPFAIAASTVGWFLLPTSISPHSHPY